MSERRQGRPIKYAFVIDLLIDEKPYNPSLIATEVMRKKFKDCDADKYNSLRNKIRKSMAYYGQNWLPEPNETLAKKYPNLKGPLWTGKEWKKGLKDAIDKQYSK